MAVLPVRKNHDFACLGCGTDLEKGERYCPQCGRENPGNLLEADRKIPANEDADKPARRKDTMGMAGKKGAKSVGWKYGRHMSGKPRLICKRCKRSSRLRPRQWFRH